MSDFFSTARLREIEALAEGARSLAERQLAELGLPLTLEMDLRYVATALTGGDVEEVPNLSDAGERLAGCLEQNRPMPRLRYEAYDPRVRQRFSISHELGHFFLHSGMEQPVLRRCAQIHVDTHEEAGRENGEQGPLIEREADAFAAAFLVPAGLLRVDLGRFGCCASFLAARYQVSEPAMRRRIRMLKSLDRCEG